MSYEITADGRSIIPDVISKEEWLALMRGDYEDDGEKRYDPNEPRDSHGRWTRRPGARKPKPSKRKLRKLSEIREALLAMSTDKPSAVLAELERFRMMREAEPPIYVGNDIDAAAKLLEQGHRVELHQPDQVSVLLDTLAKRVQQFEKMGQKAPVYDLCKVSVRGSNVFCAESRGFARVTMPQLKGFPLKGTAADMMPRDKRGEVDLSDEFRAMLTGRGVKIRDGVKPAANLRPAQRDLNGAKVAGIMQAMERGVPIEGRVFVSRDNYIIDGHHRWAAKVGKDARDGVLGDEPMEVAVIDMSITDLLWEANAFAAAMGIPQAGLDAKFGENKGDDESLYDMIQRAVESVIDGKFDPNQLRDPWGRWTEEGGSAVAERGMSFDEFKGIFDGFEAGGLRAEIGPSRKWPPAGGRVNLNIRAGDRTVGIARYSFQGAEAEIDLVYLEPEHRKGGFATELTHHFLDSLREKGFEKVKLTAVEDGSYVWSRMGFRWPGSTGKSQQMALLGLAHEDGRLAEAAKHVPQEMIEEFTRKALDHEFESEAEMASFGREKTWRADGKLWWLGKRVMVGGYWHGEREP